MLYLLKHWPNITIFFDALYAATSIKSWFLSKLFNFFFLVFFTFYNAYEQVFTIISSLFTLSFGVHFSYYWISEIQTRKLGIVALTTFTRFTSFIYRIWKSEILKLGSLVWISMNNTMKTWVTNRLIKLFL